MRHLNLLIKPASGSCNLRCKYCFYHDLTQKNEMPSRGWMTEAILEEIVKKALTDAESSCTFAFQGGEPTFVKMSFYQKLIELQRKYNRKNIKIVNALQTNGLLIDEQWAEFLATNNFLVGVSLDGPKKIHDLNRVDVAGIGTFSRVMKTIALLDKHQVAYNILFVVHSKAARHANQLYNFFQKHNFKYLQFIPCLDPLGEEPGKLSYSLTPKCYQRFLINFFNRWVEDLTKGQSISIRYFDNLVRVLMGNAPEICGMNGSCEIQFVIEADGSVYPCDFYVLDSWKIGHIEAHTFKQMSNSSMAQQFLNASNQPVQHCAACDWLQLCRGGCRRNREPFRDGEPSLNYLCEAYQGFFQHAFAKLASLGAVFRAKGSG